MPPRNNNTVADARVRDGLAAVDARTEAAMAAADTAPAPPRREYTPTTPLTHEGRTVTVPPINRWVSPGLLGLMDYGPNNPNLRGMIRAELNIVIERRAYTADELKQFVVDRFLQSRPWVAYGLSYFLQGRLAELRMYNDPVPAPAAPAPQPDAPATEAPTQTRRNAVNPAPPPPAFQVDPDGSFILTGIRLQGVERGRAAFENQISYTGQIRIPGDIARQGEEAIQAFLRNNRTELEENTENYIYDEWETASVNINRVEYNRDIVRQALQQIGTR